MRMMLAAATNVLEQTDVHREVLLKVCREATVDDDYVSVCVTQACCSLRDSNSKSKGACESVSNSIVASNSPRAVGS